MNEYKYYSGVSVVVCAHNAAKRISQMLQYLIKQKVSRELHWELIIIDNASTDNTSEVARQIWPTDGPAPIRIVRESQVGLAYARERAFREAKYELVAFLDDDNWPDPGWVQTVSDVMHAHPEVGACGGLNEPVFESHPPKWLSSYFGGFAIGPQADQTGYVSEERGFLWGAGLIVRKSIYNTLIDCGFRWQLIGRRGNQLNAGEDGELSHAIVLSGAKLWYEETLRLKHFIEVERMSWAVVKQMYQMFYVSSNILDLYKGKEPLCRTAFACWLKLFFRQFFSLTISCLCSLGNIIFLKKKTGFELNHTKLSWIRLKDLIFERKKYIRAYENILTFRSTLSLCGKERARQIDNNLTVDEYGIFHVKDKNILSLLHSVDPFLGKFFCDFFSRGQCSVADFGCGTGGYLRMLHEYGIESIGYDGCPETPEITGNLGQVLNLAEPFDLNKKYDWILSLEVGEHIPRKFEKVFIDNLLRHATKGIILSWAVPGQGGDGHVNERPNAYIKEAIAEKGWRNDIQLEQNLRQVASLEWFKNTIMCFVKK